MPSRDEVAYFGAGPARLPTAVLERAATALVNYEDTGLGLAEISHRSPTATQILNDAKASLASILQVPDSYEILFCHGGGSGEFSAAVYNMVAHWVERRRRVAEKELGTGAEHEADIVQRVKKEIKSDLKLDYLVTGSWSIKASQEAAKLLGTLDASPVNVAVDARKSNGGKFGTIPSESEWSLTKGKSTGGSGSAMVYFCDNETVDGVEFPSFPKSLEEQGTGEHVEPLVVADMSSNILSRKVDVPKYAVIFGGAQKNIGVTGVTIVIVRKEILECQPTTSFLNAVGIPSAPTILHWPTLAKNNSLYNTISIFDIYIAGQVMQDILQVHGNQQTSSQQNEADEKASRVYGVLDANPDLFQICPDKSVRSRMNICFRIAGGDDAKEKAFLQGAEKRGLMGLKGHRSVGGIRASNYNAVSVQNIEKLVAYLEDFVKENKS